MMKQTVNTISSAIATELNLATKAHGRYFSSPHEGYGVLMEEIWEARVHTQNIDAMSDNLLMLLHMVEKCPDAYEKQLAKIREEAKKGAAELCQVAAMCEKGMRSMREEATRQRKE